MRSFNQAFSKSTLARFLYPDDFYRDSNLSNDDYRNKLLEQALEIATSNFEGGSNHGFFYQSDKDRLKGKKTYFSSNLEEKLVLRRCSYNVAKSLKVKPQNRHKVCKEIKSFLREGSRYRIYKLDIKSFFESILLEDIKSKIRKKVEVSTHTKNILISYLSNFSGYLPRGLEFSSTIAEVMLDEFDKHIMRNKEVIYYNRFVDDIFIITTSLEDGNKFYKDIQNHLPNNVYFNYNKKKIISVKKRKKAGDKPEGNTVAKFDYLGYEFKVIDTHIPGKGRGDLAIFRDVKIEMSNRKIKSFKTKISKSLVSYNKDGNFELLKARISFLTSNRDLVQKKTNHKIPTGIYYNFSLLTEKSDSLCQLDISLQKFIFGYDSLFNTQKQNNLNLLQKRNLLKYSFKKGFEDKIYKKYSPDRLKEITKIWK
ncbi:antiviral reverse transcriptase Drt3a [Vibrio parahaemolyticus]